MKTEGLSIPDKVFNATKEYREESDTVGTFLNLTLIESECCRVPTAALYRKYSEWTKENGYRSISNKNFVVELRRRYDIRRDGQRGHEVVGFDYIHNNAPH